MEHSEINFFQEQILELYKKGQYKEALSLVENEEHIYIEYQAILNYWKATLYAGNGELESALSVLEKAIDAGFWFSEALMKENPAFNSLKHIQAFQKLAERNQLLREEDPTISFPMLTIRPDHQCMPEQPACPILLVFHANASNAPEALQFWQPAAQEGWVVSVLQSPHAIWKDSYLWQDIPKAFERMEEQLENLASQFHLDTNRLVIAGEGSSAALAVRLAMEGDLSLSGFIAVDPINLEIQDLKEWSNIAISINSNPLKGIIFLSYHDEQESKRDFARYRHFEHMKEFFSEIGILCRIDTYQRTDNRKEIKKEEDLKEILAYFDN
jgi:tetratricopeptide (TPR) repeat protein